MNGLFEFSIPKTLWFSLLQLTGEGGYEGYPYTWPALLLSSITMVVASTVHSYPPIKKRHNNQRNFDVIFSSLINNKHVVVGLFALPVGIIANGFLTEYNKIRYE
jgi:hypothetical protein